MKLCGTNNLVHACTMACTYGIQVEFHNRMKRISPEKGIVCDHVAKIVYERVAKSLGCDFVAGVVCNVVPNIV